MWAYHNRLYCGKDICSYASRDKRNYKDRGDLFQIVEPALPVDPAAISKIKENFKLFREKKRLNSFVLGQFTDLQFLEINQTRANFNRHMLLSKDIVFSGKHIFERRHQVDGYNANDIIDQIISGLSAVCVPRFERNYSIMVNPNPRLDRYGAHVSEEVIFLIDAQKPNAQLYSVVPKGDIAPSKRRPK